MLTRNHRQEGLSRAYVQAVAAQAGVVCSRPEPDYGIDLSLRLVEIRGQRHRDVSVQLDLQLRSTARAAVGAAEITYDLDVVTYDDLREQRGGCPSILVLLVMPDEEDRWLSQSAEELTIRHCAYWLSLRGAPARPSSSTLRVTIPVANMFTPAVVRDLLQRLRRGESL